MLLKSQIIAKQGLISDNCYSIEKSLCLCTSRRLFCWTAELVELYTNSTGLHEIFTKAFTKYLCYSTRIRSIRSQTINKYLSTYLPFCWFIATESRFGSFYSNIFRKLKTFETRVAIKNQVLHLYIIFRTKRKKLTNILFCDKYWIIDTGIKISEYFNSFVVCFDIFIFDLFN